MAEEKDRTNAEGNLDAILGAAQARDHQAREQMLDSCRGYLLAIAQSNLDELLRAKSGSSDVVQETRIRAHAAFHQFRGSTYPKFLAWHRQVLVNDLVDGCTTSCIVGRPGPKSSGCSGPAFFSAQGPK